MIRILPSFRFLSLLSTLKPRRRFCSLASSFSPARKSPRQSPGVEVEPASTPNPLKIIPKTPLFLRPPKHSAPLSEVRKWHEWAKNLASSVGSSFSDADDGPDSVLLLRELKWLIEDSIEDDPSVIHRGEIGGNSENLKLRASMEELYALWRERIEERRPFQYVVGCEHWRDLVLCVEEGILIPRPETELIVDLVEKLVARDEGFKEGFWADLGTGSGAIAIGVARVLGSRGKVIATDLSPVAVAIAGHNVQRYGLQEMIEVRQGSWFEPLNEFEGKLMGLVSNPPYIPSDNISGLQEEVSRHEPRLALDGGIDGTDCLLHLCHGASRMLKAGGFFAFETNGEKQSELLVDYMTNDPMGSFADVKAVSDFAGIKRFVTGVRR